MYVFLYGNNFIPLSYKRKNRNLGGVGGGRGGGGGREEAGLVIAAPTPFPT